MNLRTFRKDNKLWPESMLAHVAILVTLAALLLGVLGFLVWLGLGQPSLGTPVPAPTGTAVPPAGRPLTAGERLDSFRLALAIVAGIGGIVALTVAYRKQRHSEAAERREDTKLFTERFVKATDQLGNAEARVRVAGVYSVAELADDWEHGRQMCIDVLCAYIRIPYELADRGEREVRRTLFRVIRNHLRPGEHWSRVKWSAYRFSFEGAEIDQGDLSSAELAPGGHIQFHGARFIGGFHFNGVRLNGAPVWFTSTHFGGDYFSFEKADFQGSRVSFNDAEFACDSVKFAGVRFTALDPAGRPLVTFDGATQTAGQVDWGPFPPLP